MKKTFILYLLALLSVLSLVGCCQEHQVDYNRHRHCRHNKPTAQQPTSNDRSALGDFVDPANPIGLFSSSWNPD